MIDIKTPSRTLRKPPKRTGRMVASVQRYDAFAPTGARAFLRSCFSDLCLGLNGESRPGRR